MKTLLTACLMVLTAATALANPFMAMSYEGVPWNVNHTNIDPEVNEPFDVYLVLGNTGLPFIGGYEVRIDIDNPSVFVLEVTGPNGWTNFGDNLNHLCGYSTPLPMTADDAAVLATLTLVTGNGETTDIVIGPSEPSSVDGEGPAFVNGVDLDEILVCDIPYAESSFGLAATIFGEGVYQPFAVESRSWSGVKQLFD